LLITYTKYQFFLSQSKLLHVKISFIQHIYNTCHSNISTKNTKLTFLQGAAQAGMGDMRVLWIGEHGLHQRLQGKVCAIRHCVIAFNAAALEKNHHIRFEARQRLFNPVFLTSGDTANIVGESTRRRAPQMLEVVPLFTFHLRECASCQDIKSRCL
jgi:hypothetical protein